MLNIQKTLLFSMLFAASLFGEEQMEKVQDITELLAEMVESAELVSMSKTVEDEKIIYEPNGLGSHPCAPMVFRKDEGPWPMVAAREDNPVALIDGEKVEVRRKEADYLFNRASGYGPGYIDVLDIDGGGG